MKTLRKKFPKILPTENAALARQRRVARIVHDGRGMASVEWHEAPENYQRPVLELENPTLARSSKVRRGIEVLHIKNDETFDPYEHLPDNRPKPTGRRDLRKLSEHIKMMRELEERKKRGDEED